MKPSPTHQPLSTEGPRHEFVEMADRWLQTGAMLAFYNGRRKSLALLLQTTYEEGAKSGADNVLNHISQYYEWLGTTQPNGETP